MAGDSAVEAAPFSLTVLTPTFNRAHRLPALHESLVRAGDERVEWLIVDDGSTDGTRELVAGWVAAGRVRIRYMHKDNGGKHTALNAGIATISSRLTIIVDSDDHLTDDAVAVIEAFDGRYRDRPGLAGFAFTRIQPDGAGMLSGTLPAGDAIASYIDVRVNGHVDGDMAEVFYSDVLRAYPFPVFKGERFLAEDVVWIRMGLQHDLVFVDRPIYICEYLPGGLTRTGRSLAIAAPRGAMARARLLMNPRCSPQMRLRGAALFVAYGRFAGVGVKALLRSTGYPLLGVIGLLPGLALHWRWSRRVTQRA